VTLSDDDLLDFDLKGLAGFQTARFRSCVR